MLVVNYKSKLSDRVESLVKFNVILTLVIRNFEDKKSINQSGDSIQLKLKTVGQLNTIIEKDK